VLALAVAATLAPVVAAADGPPSGPDPTKRTSTLGWLRLGGAEGCVATQPLARAVEERLGRTVFVSPADADVSVEGRIERKGQGFSATILLRDAEGRALGTRTLDRVEPRCEALTESLVLIIAVMIDPDAALAPAGKASASASSSAPPSGSATPPRSAPASSTAPPAAPSIPPPPTPARPSEPAVRVEGGLGGRLALGVVPGVGGVGVGASAFGVLVPRGFPGLQVRAAFLFPQSSAAAPGKSGAESAEVSFAHASLGSALCPLAHETGRLFLTACVEGELGLLLARPSGLPRAVNEARPTLAGGASFGLSVRLVGPLTLRAGALGLVPLLRDSFRISLPSGEDYEVFRQSPVTGALDLGLGLRFP